MGLGDSIRRFFSKRSSPQLEQLESFARERKGVEGFVEPQTATQPNTLLLVDRDGDYVRGEVRAPRDAYAFGDRAGIPVYDAQVIGYPKRMKDFERRRGTAPGRSEDFDSVFEDLERRLRDPGEEPGKKED